MAFPPIPMPRSARPGGYPAVDDFWSKLNAGIGRNSNALIGLGTGLLSAPSFDQGLAAGGQGFMQGAQADSAYRIAEEAKAARQQQINMTMEAVQQWPDLVKLLEAGNDTAPILSEAFKRMSPGYGQAGGDPFTLGPGQVRYGADGKPIAQGPEQSPENIFNIGGSNKFSDTVAGEMATQQTALVAEGRNARSNIMLLGQLKDHLSRSPQGAQGAMVQFAGNLGLPVEGASDAQAAEAIINKMIPAQRPPGSGPMSDRDLDMYKQSLPRLLNQPGGNELIIRTGLAINEYAIEQARIAEQVVLGKISLEEGLALQAAVPNPLANFGGGAPPPAGGLPGVAVDSILEKYGM